MYNQNEETRIYSYLLHICAFLCGATAAILMACFWAATAYFTGHNFGWMAIGVGIVVGLTIRVIGKGKSFAFLSAILAGCGCLCGDMLTEYAFCTKEINLSFLETITRINPLLVLKTSLQQLSGVGLLLYAIAIYEGYTLNDIKDSLFRYEKLMPKGFSQKTIAIWSVLSGAFLSVVVVSCSLFMKLGHSHSTIKELINTDQCEEAAPLAEESLFIAESFFPSDHPVIAACLYDLGMIYKEEGLNNKALVFNVNYFVRSATIILAG